MTTTTLSILRLRRRSVCLIAVLLLLLSAGALRAAEEATPPAPAPTAQATPQDEFKRGTPRSSMLSYLKACRAGDFDRAAEYLDLSSIKRAQRATRGPVLASHLKVVLDRKLWVDIDSLSRSPEGFLEDGLPASRDLVGTIDTGKGKVQILLERIPRPDGSGIWKISSSTVRLIPSLYAEYGYGRLGDILPPVFFEVQFLEIQLWQWLGILAGVFFAVFASWAIAAVFVRVISRWVDERETVIRLTAGPLRALIAVGIFYGLSLFLALSIRAQHLLAGLAQLGVIAAFTWFLIRLADVIAARIERELIERGQRTVIAVLPLGRRVTKVILAVLAALAGLQSLGVNVTGVIAGLGIGGLAVALAAQKTLENFFGGLSLIVDQPVRVGDFCRFGDKIGTIEDIGLRSTRVRTLDRTVVAVPNSEFAALQLENFARRDKIWFHPTIGLRYETTPDQMRYILVELKRLLAAHPKVHNDPARVRFVSFGAYSLDLEVFAYILTADYGEYLAIQEDLLLRIMDVVEEAGSGFAFPSNTTYLGRDDGLDADKQGEAQRRVEEWRSAGKLPLPDMPPAIIAEIDDTLDYPPKGSSSGTK